MSALCNVIVFETEFRPDQLLQALNAASETVYFYAYAEVGSRFLSQAGKTALVPIFPDVSRTGMDMESMDQAAQKMVGKHDFKRFCKAEGKSSEKTIDSIELTSLGDIVVIDLKGREFLRNMVRRMVAALASVSNGSSTLQDLEEALEGRDVSFGLAPAERFGSDADRLRNRFHHGMPAYP